jgi:hypothetical protein
MNPVETIEAVSPGNVGWRSFSVSPSSAADIVASKLLEIACDPPNWSFSCFGATVIRRAMGDHDQFYFSPRGVEMFQAMIRTHHGGPCDPPRARELIGDRTSHMMLGFKTRWELFEPRSYKRPARGSHTLDRQSG